MACMGMCAEGSYDCTATMTEKGSRAWMVADKRMRQRVPHTRDVHHVRCGFCEAKQPQAWLRGVNAGCVENEVAQGSVAHHNQLRLPGRGERTAHRHPESNLAAFRNEACDPCVRGSACERGQQRQVCTWRTLAEDIVTRRSVELIHSVVMNK